METNPQMGPSTNKPQSPIKCYVPTLYAVGSRFCRPAVLCFSRHQRLPLLFSFLSLCFLSCQVSWSGSTDWKGDLTQPWQYLALGKCLPTLTSNDCVLSFSFTFGANISSCQLYLSWGLYPLTENNLLFWTKKAQSIFRVLSLVS